MVAIIILSVRFLLTPHTDQQKMLLKVLLRNEELFMVLFCPI